MAHPLHNQTFCLQKLSSAMARTRQNARRSTGGHATCAIWAVSLPVKARASSHPMPDHKCPDKLKNNDVDSLPHNNVASLKPMKFLLHVLEWWNTPPLQQLPSSSLPSMSPTHS